MSGLMSTAASAVPSGEVIPLPPGGDVLADVRNPDRALVATWHFDQGLLVLSVWRENTCVATARLTPEEASRLAAVIVDGLGSLAVGQAAVTSIVAEPSTQSPS